MHLFNSLLTIYFVFGGIVVLRFSHCVVYGQQSLQFNNETHSQIVPLSTSSFAPSSSSSTQRTRDRDQSQHYDYSQQQQQRPKASQKYPWPQKYSTGVMINNRNLTGQKQSWDRQGDDPNRNPIHMIQQKILESELSQIDNIQDTNSVQTEEANGVRCNFETECKWEWDKTQNSTFQVVNMNNVSDANSFASTPGRANDKRGQFLYLRLLPSTTRTLKSPIFSPTRELCRLDMHVHQIGNKNGKLRIVIEPANSYDSTVSSWVPIERDGNDNSRWMELNFPIGRVSQEFRILFEVVAKGLRSQQRAHFAIDNLRMRGCFKPSNQIPVINGKCYPTDVKCKVNKIEVCIKPWQQCDINIDCDSKEDEMANCEKIPFGGMCDFETGWCGWHNSGKAIMIWERHSGPTPTERTGPDNDHTLEHFNASGHYLFVNMNQHANDDDKQKLSGFASNAVINSIVFNPPPFAHLNASSLYRHTCMARFYVHQFGKNTGSLNFSVVEIRDRENITSTLWWSSRELGGEWARIQIIMPNITSRYFVQFEARMGMRIYSDVAIDDFSLSPECFGLNIPAEHLQGYNYYDQRILQDKTPHEDFANHTVIELSTCNARGRYGPTPNDCSETYNNSEELSDIRVINENEPNPFKGVQVWRVPSENYYTIIAKGAGGGLGSRGLGSSRGALAISVFELRKDEDIHILVGQKGENACTRTHCNRGNSDNKTTPSSDLFKNSDDINSKTKQVKELVFEEMAGGGGGATFIFLINSAKVAVPILVAAGGGGLGVGHLLDSDETQHGRLFDIGRIEVSGQRGHGNLTGGAGGGWRGSSLNDKLNGGSLLEGAFGGKSCFNGKGTHGQGGFGGGAGGCITGGGGGGYGGGNTYEDVSNGEGGTSFINKKRSHNDLSFIYAGDNIGHGSVVIIPALAHPACGCFYRCVVLDEFSVNVQCICPDGWRPKKDNPTACELIYPNEIPMEYLIVFFAVVTILLIAALAALIFILYNRYQRKKQIAMRHKVLVEQDLQLSRLRHNPEDQQQSNFNPNYGNDCIINGAIDVKSLPQVTRESLRLIKALGQGAFGEVYQGLYRYRDSDSVEMPVAVKTLPEMSTGQAEADFLMEAAIMSKFKHANIVHLIGVCFDVHPRFIVLELLAGGDLKNFLREGRHKPERPSPLIIKDLIGCAVDVARGCRYMESKRFIHRDIAARNCLLSSKGPGRVVKIADFGMARDIYRSDYYRKGGKAMLPIKWMPPEAFLDGIFTSKTDVWSFGVLLWEVFSLGLMPYTGLPNRDVMQLVTGGGRLDAPSGCPTFIYTLMSSCWHSVPDARPGFQYLLDTLTLYAEDEQFMQQPVACYYRSGDRDHDATIMRPHPNDDFCLQVPSSDYLIPLPDSRTIAERLMSEGTGITLPSDTMTTCSPPIEMRPMTSSIHQNVYDVRTTNAEQNSSFVTPHTAKSRLSSNSDKLISLDTPQQTPTTAAPPILFQDTTTTTTTTASIKKPLVNEQQQEQSSFIDDNGNADDIETNPTKNHHPSMINTNINGPIQLNPATLESYANVRMMNSTAATNLGAGNGTLVNNNEKTASSPPFTIQGYTKDHYNTNATENHSEISC